MPPSKVCPVTILQTFISGQLQEKSRALFARQTHEMHAIVTVRTVNCSIAPRVLHFGALVIPAVSNLVQPNNKWFMHAYWFCKQHQCVNLHMCIYCFPEGVLKRKWQVLTNRASESRFPFLRKPLNANETEILDILLPH